MLMRPVISLNNHPINRRLGTFYDTDLHINGISSGYRFNRNLIKSRCYRNLNFATFVPRKKLKFL